MTLLDLVFTIVVVLVAVCVVLALLAGGILAWYIVDAERRSQTKFERIYPPVPVPKPEPEEQGDTDRPGRSFNTDPDQAGRPFGPLYRNTPTPTPGTENRPGRD
ncbi:hypothetical protein ED92_10665 [Amycolatopsis sp. MJM2582]|uniref:hypothetical protein n=1 Tax=Amycolatopsis sp. MJM2582 TaxID=1427749 RepID=UPI000507B2F3|nr:hypothetical protein [Amycolatopsis sp. MJM2582]KFZ80794.1 hypothetical protein ED92_10665 [Amycolatopsis sp. MJM2582]